MKSFTILLLSLLLLSGNLFSQAKDYDPILNDTVKIFFLGNSFTGVNNLPSIIENLAVIAGKNFAIDAHTPGGQSSTDHILNPIVYQKLQANDWDYVVIQDNQGAYVNNPSYVSAAVLDANFQLLDSIKSYNSCSKVVWFGGWGPDGGLPQYFPDDSTISCINRILDNMVYQNSLVDEIVAPIGEAWIKTIMEQNSINLYAADGIHPSTAGSVAAAAVLYSVIFKENPALINYTGSLSPADALYLLQTGYDVVMNENNFDEYSISGNNLQITLFNNMLEVPNTYTSFYWIKDNVPMSVASLPIIEFQGIGSYSIIAVDQYGCTQTSFPIYLEAGPEAIYTCTQNNSFAYFVNQSSNATSYEWDFGDGQTSTQINPTHEFLLTGHYTVTLTAWNEYGGANFIDTVSVQITNINSVNQVDKISVFPNPANNVVNIAIENLQIEKLEIFNSVGQLILKSHSINNNKIIDISELGTGNYYVKAICADKIFIEKFVVIK